MQARAVTLARSSCTERYQTGRKLALKIVLTISLPGRKEGKGQRSEVRGQRPEARVTVRSCRGPMS